MENIGEIEEKRISGQSFAKTLPLAYTKGHKSIMLLKCFPISTEEPLWLEFPGIPPHTLIMMDEVKFGNHNGVFGDIISIELDVLHGGMKKAEGYN